MRTLILAGSYSEAARYARGKAITYYRYASSAAACEGFQAQQVVELPGYESRRDKHALEAVALRATRRGAKRFKDSYEPPAPPAPPAYGEPGYVPDYLLGDVPTYPAGVDQVVKALADPTPEVVAALQDVVDEARVNGANEAASLENKVSGRRSKKAPRATTPAKVVTADVDDLFED